MFDFAIGLIIYIVSTLIGGAFMLLLGAILLYIYEKITGRKYWTVERMVQDSRE